MIDIKELQGGIIKSIKEATKEVCSTMLNLQVKAEESFIKDEKNVSTDLLSSVHFFGDKYMGKIAVFAYGGMACQLAGAMLGMEVTEVDEDVKDCMGEIVNMIAGGAKTKLQDSMGLLHLLTPWVISGKNLTIASPPGGEEGLSIDSQAQFSWIMTKFILENGHFTVGVQPNEVPQRQAGNPSLEKDLQALREENERLKKEIAALKAGGGKTG